MSSTKSVIAGLALILFCAASYLPLSSKIVNNIFYIGLALPAFIWLAERPAASRVLARDFWWVIVPLYLIVIISMEKVSDLKLGAYLILFLTSLALINHNKEKTHLYFGVASIASLTLMSSVIFHWLWLGLSKGEWIRYHSMLGHTINPVHICLLLTTSIVFLWTFYVDDWLSKKGKAYHGLGLIALIGIVLLTTTVFQARSALLGFSLFLMYYLYYKKLWLPAIFAAGIILAAVCLTDVDTLLLQRGFSYRPEIWTEAWLRLINECGLLVGCRADDYLFLDQFSHPHSAYLSILYHWGLLGAVPFLFFSAMFFWKTCTAKSRWLLVSLIGWGALITTSNGTLTSPSHPLWIYFWLPVFLAILESQPQTLRTYFSLRDNKPINGEVTEHS